MNGRLDAERMTAENEARETLPCRWVPSADRMPPDRTIVLAFSNGRMLFGYAADGDWIDMLYGWTLRDGPTHWMPLPEPPGHDSNSWRDVP